MASTVALQADIGLFLDFEETPRTSRAGEARDHTLVTVRWTSMELAALATAAVPGLSPTGVAAVADDARDFTSAIVIDSEGNRWRVRSPQHQEAAMRLETELQVLRGFTTAIRAELPFRAPSVAGAVRRGEMRTFVYNHLPGQTLELEELAGHSPEVIRDIGRTIAAIHDLDEAVVDNADLPRYSAERFRQRRLNELDQAATTGQIPATLLRRWEHAMEEKLLWDFAPVVTHGDLHEDNLHVDGERVVAVTGWTDLHIGDPADDFAWLTATPDTTFSRAVLAEYQSHRHGSTDPHLLRRAALTAEFALAQWLVRGHATKNEEMVEEARALLAQLEKDIEAHGGQPIALGPMEGPLEGRTGAEDQDSKPVVRAGAAATVADTGQWAETGADDHEPAVITDASAHEQPPEQGLKQDDRPDAAASQEHRVEQVLDDDTPTGQFPAVEQEQDTGAIPQMVDDAEFGLEDAADDDRPTGTIPPVPDREAHPISEELPIVANAESEKRAKQKNFFPSQSAESARSAESADTGAHPVVPAAEPATESAPDSAEDQAEDEDNRLPPPLRVESSEPQDSRSDDVEGSAVENEPQEEQSATEPQVESEVPEFQEDPEMQDGPGPEGPTSSSGSSTRDSVYSSYPGLRPRNS